MRRETDKVREHLEQAAQDIVAERKRENRIVILSLAIIGFFVAVPSWLSLVNRNEIVSLAREVAVLSQVVCDELVGSHRQRNELAHEILIENQRSLARLVGIKGEVVISKPHEISLIEHLEKCSVEEEKGDEDE